MKKEFSKLFRLNWYDIFKGVIICFLTSLGDFMYQALAMWMDNHQAINVWEILKVAGISTAMYLLKNFFTSKPTPPVEPMKPDADAKTYKE